MSLKNKLKMLLAVPLVAGSLALVGGVAPVSAACDVSGGLKGAAECSKADDQPGDLFGDGGIFETVVNVLLFLIGAIAVIMLIVGGLRYTTSNGNSDQVEKAKQTIMYAIVGIIVAVFAYAIVNFVIDSLAANN